MENKNEESLIKSRSPRACMSTGFRLYLSHFKRIFKTTWWAQLVFAVVSGVAEALLVVYYPLVVLSLLVLWYLLYRFLLRRRLTMLAPTHTGFKACLRHLAPLFIVSLVTFIACSSLWLLTSVPAVILGIANIQAETGVLFGDALGMPSYMKWLTMAVFTLSSFMQAYIYLAYYFPMRYAYGSIEAEETERNNALNKIQTNA
jgi:hypothetical protein